MKKLLFVLILAAGMIVPAVSQASVTSTKPIWDRGDNVSELSYQNFVVSRIYDSSDAYTVLYEKSGYEIGKVSIPKSWAHQGLTVEEHKNHKLFFRNKVKTLDNMMTIYYRNGEFYKVILTVPTSKADPVWAVAPNGYDPEISQDMTSIDVKF